MPFSKRAHHPPEAGQVASRDSRAVVNLRLSQVFVCGGRASLGGGSRS
jgi:hypothetical protein